jgi:hypothetical protein
MKPVQLAKISIISILGLTVSACGGGGGSVASTPAPPPAPTYTTIPNLTGNQTFNTASSGFRFRDSAGAPINPVSSPISSFGSTITIAYNATNGDYTLSGNGVTETFTSANNDSANTDPGVSAFVKRDASNQVTSSLRILTPSPGGVNLSYTRIGRWYSITDPAGGRVYFASGGVPTIASDMPRSGSATYGATIVSGTAIASLTPQSPRVGLDIGGSSANLEANFATGAISSQLSISGRPSPVAPATFLGQFVGSGTISSGTNTFAGTYTPLGGPTAATGEFRGAFFGPQAIEYGLVFSINGTLNGQVFTVNGAQAGRQAPNTQLFP